MTEELKAEERRLAEKVWNESYDAIGAMLEFHRQMVERRPTPADAGEVREKVARALYELEPFGDQETDLDGRPTGPGYEIQWDDLPEYSPDAQAEFMARAEQIIAGAGFKSLLKCMVANVATLEVARSRLRESGASTCELDSAIAESREALSLLSPTILVKDVGESGTFAEGIEAAAKCVESFENEDWGGPTTIAAAVRELAEQ